MLRLFEESLPIASFDRGELSEGGRVVPVEEPEGLHLRNTMHNTLVADAFVSAGGRPNTIHESNWTEFLAEERDVRLRIEGVVYELEAVPVVEAAERAAVAAEYVRKYDVDEEDNWVTVGQVYRLDRR